MSRQSEALQLALEALAYAHDESLDENHFECRQILIAQIKAIREALAEPEQEPATWQYRWLNPNKMDCEPFEMDWKAVATGPGLTLDAAISDLEAYKDRSGKSVYEVRPLYATPPARKPLTDEEINALELPPSGCNFRDIVRVIERAHGIS